MARVIAFAVSHARDRGVDRLRSLIVCSCAVALIAAGQFLPALPL